MINKILSIFGRSDEDKGGSGAKETSRGSKDIENFVDYVVRALVDSPEKVRIEKEKDEEGGVIKIHCEKSDIGKVIGKNGKTIMAIRALVSSAAGREGRRTAVEVID